VSTVFLVQWCLFLHRDFMVTGSSELVLALSIQTSTKMGLVLSYVPLLAIKARCFPKDHNQFESREFIIRKVRSRTRTRFRVRHRTVLTNFKLPMLPHGPISTLRPLQRPSDTIDHLALQSALRVGPGPAAAQPGRCHLGAEGPPARPA
jgi:hypothetical protein